ncbi:MAG: GNAT family N-acetyltransferase [Pseudomonadales bacterium]|nr:GNAT family N-acetyltransferase [Pseudomonadales bacterium]
MIKWQWLTYTALSKNDLYAIMKVRQQVFILEQQCFYLDIDDLDSCAWHLIGRKADADQPNAICAYLRVMPPGAVFDECSIGRVLTSASVRGRGMGKVLMQNALMKIDELYPGEKIRISAQAHLQPFYTDLGFMPVSQPYDEDGIAHIQMLK